MEPRLRVRSRAVASLCGYSQLRRIDTSVVSRISSPWPSGLVAGLGLMNEPIPGLDHARGGVGIAPTLGPRLPASLRCCWAISAAPQWRSVQLSISANWWDTFAMWVYQQALFAFLGFWKAFLWPWNVPKFCGKLRQPQYVVIWPEYQVKHVFKSYGVWVLTERAYSL